MAILRQFVRVYIPHAKMQLVSEHRNAMTKQAGGCSITEARGEWFNDAGEIVRDHINICTWWHNERHQLDYDQLVDALLNSGEVSVMVELKMGDSHSSYIFDKA